MTNQQKKLAGMDSLLTVLEAVQWMQRATSFFNGTFHPDTRASEYIDIVTGKCIFGQQSGYLFNDRRLDCFRILGDELIYEIGMLLIKEQRS